jgi:2-hydroxychromene-2-carboxylate isomerase
MSIRGLVQAFVSRRMTSKTRRDRMRRKIEAARRGNDEPHRVTAFLRIDDPYSVLLAEALAEFVARYDVALDIEIVDAEPADYYPAPGALAQLARSDALPMAKRFGLAFPDVKSEPSAERIAAALAVVAAAPASGRLEAFRGAAQALWRDDAPVGARDPGAVAGMLAAGNSRLQSLGHYLSGMLLYGGEWYWGLDRLDHLEHRLIELGAVMPGQPATPRFDRSDDVAPLDAKSARSAGGLLTVFFSLRSPYSYIGFERALALAERHGAAVDIRPVLPMLMRGLKVPPIKSRYILMDSAREAERLGIPFGRIVDPLGAGVERAYALVDYARNEGRLAAYFASVLRGAWADGLELASDRGLRVAVERAGLDWARAKPLIGTKDWRQWAEVNQAALSANGFWGVPSFTYGDVKVWGQDRLWRIERAMREAAG